MQVKPAALDFPIEKWVSKQHAHIELIDQVVVDVVVFAVSFSYSFWGYKVEIKVFRESPGWHVAPA